MPTLHSLRLLFVLSPEDLALGLTLRFLTGSKFLRIFPPIIEQIGVDLLIQYILAILCHVLDVYPQLSEILFSDLY